MTNSENAMMAIRPPGPRSMRVKPLPCGMRSVIFCLALCLAGFVWVFATTSNSLMTAHRGAEGRQTGDPEGTPACPTLAAAGAGIEVQVDGVAGHADADKVADVDSE